MATTFEHTLKSGNRRLGLNEYTSNELFSPAGMPGLYAWVHPESGFYQDAAKLTASVNASSVYTWADASGHGYDFIQATADRRPIYYDNMLNGYPAIQFNDSVNDYMHLFATFPSVAQPVTVALVGWPIDTTSAPFYSSFYNGQSNFIQLSWAKNDDQTLPPYIYAGGIPTRTSLWPAWSFLGFNYATVVFNGTNCYGEVNGSGSYAVGTCGTGATGTGMYLGGGTAGSGGIMHSYIAEFCIFTTAFTPTQVKNLNAYFKEKYALP